jgi:hypothetical protein
MIGPLSIVSGVATLAMLPPAVDADTRRHAVRALAVQAGVDPTIARAIRRAAKSPEARGKLEVLIVAMGRVLIAAREVG